MEPIKAELSYSDAFDCLSTYELATSIENALEEGLNFLEANEDQSSVTILLTIKR